MSVNARIIGIGNPLCGDDGIGIEVVKRLEQAGLPHGVEVLDGGLGGLSLIDYFEEVEQVILVDAVDTGRPAGQITVFNLEDFKLDAASAQHFHAGLPGLLALVQQLEICPRVQLVAVQPQTLEVGQPLSAPVSGAFNHVVATVLALLS